MVKQLKLPLQTPHYYSSIPRYGSGLAPWASTPCGRRGISPWVTLIIYPNQVVGVKDSRMGEEICACIRVKTGQECTEEEIKAFCKGKVGLPGFGSPPEQYTQLGRPMDLEELGIQLG